MAGADSVIPPPLDDDDDDVAWALQTAAVQWARGGRADAVVWLRRAVDAAIAAGNPQRTKDLTRLASQVADRLVEEAARAPDSAVPPPGSRPPPEHLEDPLTARALIALPTPASRPPARTLTSEIPIEFSDDTSDDDFDEEFEDDEDLEDDEAPTIPPPPNTASLFSKGTVRLEADTDPADTDPDAVEASDEPFISDSTLSTDETHDVTSGDVWSARSSLPSEDGEMVAPDEVWSAPQPSPFIERSESNPPEVVPNPPSEPPWEGPAVVGGIALESVRGFEDLPEETQGRLARIAQLTTLAADEEVGSFGAALVTNGKVGIMPSIADVASAVASAGEVVFTRGSLVDGVALRVVALEDDTVVASWTPVDLEAAFADCPWVADELRLVADRFQALAGATLGLLGERLDEALRGLVLSRLDVKVYGPGEIIVSEGNAVPGLHIVGGGKVELLEAEVLEDDATAGEFLFAAEVLSGGKAHQTARAGKSGALVLFASRGIAHEMLMSVPPLLEILAG